MWENDEFGKISQVQFGKFFVKKSINPDICVFLRNLMLKVTNLLEKDWKL